MRYLVTREEDCWSEFFGSINRAFPNFSMVPVMVFSCAEEAIFSEKNIGGRQEG